MLGIERRQHIIEQLKLERKVYVSRLSDELGVTQETIRRDLEKLETGGLLQRSHGGAVLLTPSNEDLSITNRASANFALKQTIAAKAAGLVHDEASLMVDSSTTVLALFTLLAAKKKELTVITNSIKLLNDHAGKDIEFISTGGNFRIHSQCFVGGEAIRTLTNFNVDLAVFSCKGLDMRQGITESNQPEAEIKNAMARQAKSRVLLADHTKFDKAFFAKTLDFSDIDYVVTDSELDTDWIRFFEQQDIQLI